MRDLTVTDIHTYYVLAGNTPVLVRNYNCRTFGTQAGTGLSDEELLDVAVTERDSFARDMGNLPQRKRPAVVTAGYNIETRQYAAAANSQGAGAEMCVINQLGGDQSKIRFTSAVRHKAEPEGLKQVPVCLVCEVRYGRVPFADGTKFGSDYLAQFYDPFPRN